MLKSKVSQQDTVVTDQTAQLNARDQEIEALKAVVEECKAKIMEHEDMRKKLHNEIQELKGNIRVFCRVRPQLESEALSEESKMVMQDDKPNTIELVQSLVPLI